MSHSIVGLLLIQIVLIALNAVFASAELAVLSVNEGKIDRLAEQGNRKAKRLRNLTKEPAKFLSFRSPLRCPAFWAARLRRTVFPTRWWTG